MSETLTVRETTEADAAVLSRHEPRSGLVARLMERAGEDYVVASAWRGEEPLGWGVLDLSPADDESDEVPISPQLSDLWVLPTARRQGVGHAVSQWLEQRARTAGLREVFLLVDPKKESAAIPLYLDLDYTPTGDHRLGEVVETGEQTHQAIYRKSLTIAG